MLWTSFGLARAFAVIMRPPILAGGQFKMPAGEIGSLRVFPGNSLPLVRFDLELSLSADVREMRHHGADLGPAACDLDHQLRSPPHRPPDLLDLRGAEPISGRSPSAEAGRLQNGRSPAGKRNGRLLIP